MPASPAHPQHVPGAPVGAGDLAPGKALRRIIKSVIAQKSWCIKHIGHAPAPGPMGMLEVWLRQNPTPSAATVRNLPPYIRTSVETLMLPQNKNQLAEFRQLIATT